MNLLRSIAVLSVTLLTIYGATSLLENIIGYDQMYVQEGLAPLGSPSLSGDRQEEKFPPVIRLEDHKGKFFCSGFVIDDNYAITAAHCVFDKVGKKINVTPATQAGVAGYNTRMDYALLSGDFRQYQKLKVILSKGVANVLSGHPVFACGYPNGQHNIECLPAYVKGAGLFGLIAKGELYPGMSGGPVIEPESSIVVGLNQGVMEGLQDIFFSALTGFAGNFGIEPLQ